MDDVILKESRKGLTIGRRALGFHQDRRAKHVRVFYEQYLVTPDGSEVEHEPRTYLVKDQPATYHQKNAIKTPAVYSTTDGSIEEEAELYDGTELIDAGHTQYSDWVKDLESAGLMDKIQETLGALPGSVPSEYHVGNPNN
jgi:hypothetical protein